MHRQAGRNILARENLEFRNNTTPDSLLESTRTELYAVDHWDITVSNFPPFQLRRRCHMRIGRFF